MVHPDLMRGPNLSGGVDPECAEDLQALALEQRARIEQVREWEHWEFYGEMLGSEWALEALYGQLLVMVVVTLMLLIAPFHSGLGLAVLAAMGLLGLLPDLILYRPARRNDVERRRRFELRPAAVFAAHPGSTDPDHDALEPIHVVLGRPFQEPEEVWQLVRAAEALEMETPPEVARAVSESRRDGSRQIAGETEIAHLDLPHGWLPEGRLTSRLLFVLVDPATRGPFSAAVPPYWLWGEGTAPLLNEHPWRPR
jgi:hypothetical protein